MNEPRKLNRVVIKEELVELTGHYIKALILQQMIFWSERVNDFDLFLAETKRRHENSEVDLQYGWIYKNSKELSKELMIDASHQTMRRYLQSLVEDGFILERHNPKKTWDRTMQYRVDLVAVARALNKIGYSLEGYSMLDASNVQNGQSNVQNGQSSVQIGQSSVQNGDSNVQNGQAIPETTTKTTPKTTAKKQKRTNELPARAPDPAEIHSFVATPPGANGRGVNALPQTDIPENGRSVDAISEADPDPPVATPPPTAPPESEQAVSIALLTYVGMSDGDAVKLGLAYRLEYVERQVFAWRENGARTGKHTDTGSLMRRFREDYSAAELTDADRDTDLYRHIHPEYRPANGYKHFDGDDPYAGWTEADFQAEIARRDAERAAESEAGP